MIVAAYPWVNCLQHSDMHGFMGAPPFDPERWGGGVYSCASVLEFEADSNESVDGNV